MASSRVFPCHSQNPAISSFVSAKGPSITVRLLPENLTRAPFELAWSPSAASSTPAFSSCMLNLPISVRLFSSGRPPASESLLALTRIMNRIVLSSWLSTYTTSEGRGNRRFGRSLSDPSRVCCPHPLAASPFRRGGTHDVPPLPKGEGIGVRTGAREGQGGRLPAGDRSQDDER